MTADLSVPLPPAIVLALRDECLAIHQMAMELFDSMEGGTLTAEGAQTIAALANRAESVRRDTSLALAAITGMGFRR